MSLSVEKYTDALLIAGLSARMKEGLRQLRAKGMAARVILFKVDETARQMGLPPKGLTYCAVSAYLDYLERQALKGGVPCE